MCVFVDVVPLMDKNGELITDEDGIPLTAPDYTVCRILDTQKGKVARYGIKKVGGAGE